MPCTVVRPGFELTTFGLREVRHTYHSTTVLLTHLAKAFTEVLGDNDSRLLEVKLWQMDSECNFYCWHSMVFSSPDF